MQQQQRTHYVKVSTKGDIENFTDVNENEELKTPLKNEWQDEEDAPCLRYANPIMLVIALMVLFTTVFCVIYYGTINSRGLINRVVPGDFDDGDVSSSSFLMVTGKLLTLYSLPVAT